LLVTGSPAEAAAAGRLAAAVSRGLLTSLAGTVDLEGAVSLLGRARLVVTGDSGPLHVAAALGTPVVALFGPTWPERTGPWGQPDAVVQASRPAHPHAYRDDPAGCHIRALAVEPVLEAVRRRLAA
jgi:ADP-heptose:LPS heptosyltransferase